MSEEIIDPTMRFPSDKTDLKMALKSEIGLLLMAYTKAMQKFKYVWPHATLIFIWDKQPYIPRSSCHITEEQTKWGSPLWSKLPKAIKPSSTALIYPWMSKTQIRSDVVHYSHLLSSLVSVIALCSIVTIMLEDGVQEDSDCVCFHCGWHMLESFKKCVNNESKSCKIF